ncbi:uncharacterized protein DUF2213 [Trinickia symbiotica]|nr:uncharacterized protein DUF2213 [Trinickia symbiotica]
MPLFDCEVERPFRRMRGRGNTFYPADELARAEFLETLEGLPLLVTHEGMSKQGFTSNGAFDGEWVRADVTVSGIEALAKVFAEGMVQVSLATKGKFVRKQLWAIDRGYQEICDGHSFDLRAVHLAIVPLGRVQGARLDF